MAGGGAGLPAAPLSAGGSVGIGSPSDVTGPLAPEKTPGVAGVYFGVLSGIALGALIVVVVGLEVVGAGMSCNDGPNAERTVDLSGPRRIDSACSLLGSPDGK